MYPTANVVIFVDIERVFEQVERLLQKHPLFLCVSYDTDLLAFEGVTSFVRRWLEFAQRHPSLTIEVRTKSANYNSIADISPLDNAVLAWTVSPQTIIEQFEHRTPSLSLRLKNIKQAMDDGWKVRLCFDPMLYVNGWKEVYAECVDKVFAELKAEQVLDVSTGVFRVGKDYLKQMKKANPNSKILAYPFVKSNDDVYTYQSYVNEEMLKFMQKTLSNYIKEQKIYL